MAFVKKTIDKNKMLITKGEMTKQMDPQKTIILEDMIMGTSSDSHDQKINQIPDINQGRHYAITEQAIKREHDNNIYAMASNL